MQIHTSTCAHAGRRPTVRWGFGAALLAGLTLLALAPAAPAWPRRHVAPPRVLVPGVYTGPARSGGDGGATLRGLVNPHGSATSYYFQYGPTAAYGAQTPAVAAGAGLRIVRVAAAVSGLRPLTVYHYRLVAVNAAGAHAGADRAFRTLGVPPPVHRTPPPPPIHRAPPPPVPPRAPAPQIHRAPLPPIHRATVPGPPRVYTDAATGVSYGSATLTGAINPRGSATSYYFQYGPTRAYGAQTAVASAGAGVSVVKVAVPVSGLAPVTLYHFRLIAVNAAGAATGADRVFATAKVPLSLAILGAPNPTLYGSPVAIEGTLSGTGAAGVPVVLQANPFPYTQGFADVGNPELTTATGGFSFPVLGLVQATQFRVVTTTRVPVVSPVATEGVAVRVEAHVRRARRRHHARIYGTVTPAVNGMEVAIIRVAGGHETQVASTFLRPRTATTSRFSRVVRVRPHSLYRVLVRVTNGAQTSNYSEPLFIR
jgi:hypothetical protein